MENKNLPKNQIPPEENKSANLEAIKSIYYWLNAKPDTQIKIFKEPKIISLNDIENLNDQINRKLANHDLQTSMVQANVLLSNGDIRSFGTWGEFISTHWDAIPIETESISINWDLNIKLPHYELPQRHTMKVRLGSPLKPNEFFQMMVNSDDDAEIQQSIAPVICKVDFINSVIANELIQIVENWYNCLPKTKPRSQFQNFTEKHGQQIARITHILVIITGLLIALFFFKRRIESIKDFVINQDLIISGYYWIIITLITYFISNFFGGMIGRLVYKTVGKIEDFPIFNISRGDKNEIHNVISKNKKVSRDMVIQVSLTLIGTIISFLLDKIFQ